MQSFFCLGGRIFLENTRGGESEPEPERRRGTTAGGDSGSEHPAQCQRLLKLFRHLAMPRDERERDSLTDADQASESSQPPLIHQK